ncbi:MAG: LapA family protein [Aestuariivita sp.]|nr:LapA family protein [Aestuariivita sp.]
MANRSIVTLSLFPQELSDYFGIPWQFEVPLFIAVFGGIIAGLLFGLFWEWMREYKHRREAYFKGREARRLEREISRLKSKYSEENDGVLALLKD